MRSIIETSIRYRFIVLIVASVFLCIGVIRLRNAKYDVFPEFAPSQIEIQTEARGLSPEQVELLVTHQIEIQLNGVPGLTGMRSTSVQGLSVISLLFDSTRDVRQDRQAVSERLSGMAASLPQGVLAPTMAPLISSAGDLMTVGFTSDSLSLTELRSLIEWTIKPRLLSVAGVAKIGVFGGKVAQIQILVKPEKLLQYDLSLDDVVQAAQKATGIRGGGFVDTPTQRVIIKTDGQLSDKRQIARAALVRIGGDTPVSATIGDVADVIDGFAPEISAATVMKHPGVVLNLWSQYGANTLETTKKIDEELLAMKSLLDEQHVEVRSDLFRSENFISASVYNMQKALLTGAALVTIVLIVFLFNWQSALICCSAIPLSLLGAVWFLEYCGFTLNTMTLGGLAIALGEVVDDAVIGVENVLRRLRHEDRSAGFLQVQKTILEATLEVRGAVIFGTLAVTLVFLPILTMGGLAGSLFGPLGISYISAIFMSLVVALTVTPAFCALLLRRKNLSEHDTFFVRRVRKTYERILEFVERRPSTILMLVGIFLTVGIVIATRLEGNFLPAFKENHFIIHITAEPGANLTESVRIGNEATKKLKEFPWVRSVAQRVGRAAADDTFGPNESELEVDLTKTAPDDAESLVRQTLEGIDEAEITVNSFLSERIEETISGFTAPIVIRVFGSDLEAIDQRALEIIRIIKGITGTTDVKIDSPSGSPYLKIKLKPEALLKWGLEPVAVLDAIETSLNGSSVGQIFDGNRIVNIALSLAFKGADRIVSIRKLPIRNIAGTYIPLENIASITETTDRMAINHENAARVQTVTCNVEGRNVSDVLRDIKEQIGSQPNQSKDTYIDFQGMSEEQATSQNTLLLHSLFTGIGILLLLSIELNSFPNLLLVVCNLPMALVGGVLMAYLYQEPVSMGILVGFVTLFGITLRNSIMMMAHFRHLVEIEELPWNLDTVVRGASERLVPILMTAMVTGIGLLPLAMTPHAAGHEIEGPMALVILGGLLTSTVLNLLVLPTLALRFSTFTSSIGIP